jgi:hypothetical protein
MRLHGTVLTYCQLPAHELGRCIRFTLNALGPVVVAKCRNWSRPNLTLRPQFLHLQMAPPHRRFLPAGAISRC